MGKNKTLFIGFVLGIAATMAIQCSSAIAPTEAGADPLRAAPGRYQISTVMDQDRQITYVTILDTETGEILSKERYYEGAYGETQQ